MAVEITGVSTAAVSDNKIGTAKTTPANTTEVNERRRANGSGSLPAAPVDKLTLTKQAEDLRVIEDAVYAQTGIDSERVDSLRVEIDAGRYDINVQRVAEKLIAFESQFVA